MRRGSLPVHSGIPIVPQIGIGPRLSGTSQFAVRLGPMRTHEFTADIQKVRGSHTLSAGVLYFRIHAFDDGFGTAAGFDQFPSSAVFESNSNVSSTEDGLASMPLNLPSSLVVFVGNTSADIKTHWIGSYVQDKWQVSKKLNIQFGLRWDYEAPPRYRNAQFTMWNMNCPFGTFTSPDQVRATQEACLMMPVPFTPMPTAFNPNPLSWPFPNARKSIWDPKYNGWQPRFGFSYVTAQKVSHWFDQCDLKRFDR